MCSSSREPTLKGKTVLQVLPALEAGGVERGTLEIAAALGDAGVRPLVASAGGRMAAQLGTNHIRLPVDTKNPFLLWRNVARLEALIAREKVDLVHARSRAPAWSARTAARRMGVPFVTTFHGTYSARSAAKRAYNRIMTQGDRVIAISDFIAAHVREVYDCPLERLRVVHRGIDPAVFDPTIITPDEKTALRFAWRIPTGAYVALLPGRLTRWKGHAFMIEAMRSLHDRNVVAVFAGAGREAYRQELLELADGLPVRFVGHTDDMPAASAASDVVVSASDKPEAFGRVMAEAGAMGLPVVATNHGGAREIVVDGQTGWLVPPGDAASLADGIRRSLAASGPAFAARARAHVLAHFTLARMCEGTLAVYEELLSR